MSHAPWIPRAAPFAAYMIFILLEDLVGNILLDGPVKTHLTAIVYPLKILASGGILLYFRKEYIELMGFRGKGMTGIAGETAPDKGSYDFPFFPPSSRSGISQDLIVAFCIGILVFVLWINMDWPFARMGDSTGYDPRTLPAGFFIPFVMVRIFGASVVVPIFEELFWRSFILRYIIKPDFLSVPVGAFSRASFLIGAALFGAEHHLWLAGIMAGILYSLLLYRTRSIWACIIAHALTNFLLGVYVLYTQQWSFW